MKLECQAYVTECPYFENGDCKLLEQTGSHPAGECDEYVEEYSLEDLGYNWW